MDQPDQSNPVNYAVGQHFLAEIKYPNIPDIISIDKIFNVLQKIKTTSKPLFYKWQALNRPKHGEIYLEQKYPLTRDPVGGEQFPIVDDGYLWSSIPKPELREYQGQQIEVFRWVEGYSPGDQFFTISKTEYRLKLPNNVLFLIHYLNIKDPNVPIKTALPPTKVSPMYLQQQFFQYLKQHVAQMASMRRSPSPNPTAPGTRASVNKPTATHNKSSVGPQRTIPPMSAAAIRPPQQTAAALDLTESSLDVFDSFGNYEEAFYRFHVLKPLLNRIFETPPPSRQIANGSNIPEGLEADLISATKRKITSLQDRTEAFQKGHHETIQQIKKSRQVFWDLFNKLNQDVVDLDDLYKKLIVAEVKDMELDQETVYASL